MSRMKLLLDVVEDMRSLADSIQAVCEAMSDNAPAAEQEPAAVPQPEAKPLPAEKTITLEEVRPVLGRLSNAGYTEQIRSLILKYGGERLGEVDPKHYAALLKEAEELQNATE